MSILHGHPMVKSLVKFPSAGKAARRAGLVGAALLALGACAAPPIEDTTRPPAGSAPGAPGSGPDTLPEAFIEELPPEVIALAAPNQNLDAVILNPADKCYWYRHQGPVETTMVPLRAVGGGLICIRPSA